ncbi:MAG: LysR family transcriptional regulator [Pseudomonadota bacterium]
MKSDWNDLQVFLAIERGRTAREAATRLEISHSTVLRRLDAFEQRVGSRLFDRTPEGFLLTEAGGRIVGRAQQVEAEMLELERLIHGQDGQLRGQIRLTVPPPVAQFTLLPILSAFRERYPKIEIELVTTYAYSDLSRRDADLAIRFSETPEEHLVGRRLPPFHDAIYCTPGYRDRHFGLDRQAPQWISWPDRAAFQTRVKTTPYAAAEVGWTLPNLPLQAAAARAGFGMAFLPCIMGDGDPQLVRAPGTGTYSGRPAWLLTHPDLRRMERVRVFSKFLAEALNARKASLCGDLSAVEG